MEAHLEVSVMKALILFDCFALQVLHSVMRTKLSQTKLSLDCLVLHHVCIKYLLCNRRTQQSNTHSLFVERRVFLRSIIEDPEGFVENGGWEFLNMEVGGLCLWGI